MSFSLNSKTPLGPGKTLFAGLGRFKDPQVTPVTANGLITSLTINDAGSWYTATPTVAITAAAAKVDAVLGTVGVSGGGAVTSVPVTTAGHFYTSAPAISFSGGGGSGATATAVLSNGGIASITVTAGGSGYTSAPTASAASAPANVAGSATAVLGNGRVISITVGGTNTGYTSAPVITFTGGGGSGATAHAIINSKSGKVTDIVVDAVGSGYTSAPTVVLTGGGFSATATGTAIIAAQVTSFTSVAGQGYTAAPFVSFSSKPTIEVVSSPCYSIDTAIRPVITGTKGSDETADWVLPTQADDSAGMVVVNGTSGFIVISRVATSLSVDAAFALSWIGR